MQLVPVLVFTVNLERQNVELLKFLYNNWTGSSEAEQETFNLCVGISKFPRFTNIILMIHCGRRFESLLRVGKVPSVSSK
jgi:hypothetical protein